MPLFSYRIVDTHGRKLQGEIEAESREKLVENFQKQGFTVLSVKPSSSRSFASSISLFFLQNKIKTSDLLVVFSQLAAMLEAGIPLIDALKSLAEESEKKSLKKILNMVTQNISQGDTFANALAKTKIFTPLVINLVKTGEASGHLDITLRQLVKYLEDVHGLKQQIKSALTYPVFLILFAITAVIFMLTTIVPIFAKIYARFKVPLPLPTRILLYISDSLKQHIGIFLIMSISLVILFLMVRNTKKVRLVLDRLKLKLPLIGPLIKKVTLARFAASFSILIKSGIPAIAALKLAREIVRNKVIEMALNEAIFAVEQGDSLADALKKTKVFPELIIQMTSTGEKTGMLDVMLEKVARFYDDQVKLAAKNLTTMIEPVMIIILGGIIGFILLSIFLPIFKLGQVVRG
ncbi:MAG: type II secretion system F family protein [Candidatus Desulfofervidaceae bacterium]|nr:type II secretion system F family protein [Candidatus Desulfofervidaceae bacterium]